MANVCTRAYMIWADDNKKNDQSDVLVVTSLGKNFVDVRLKPGSKGIKGVYPFADIEWAFAGTSFAQVRDSTVHARWTHTVDSHNVDASTVLDEGILITQSDGSTLETGTMPRSASHNGSGAMTAYEESWVDLKPTVRPDAEIECAVLQLGDIGSEAQTVSGTFQPRGVIVRVGDYCQGILRSGMNTEAITVERWDRVADLGSWRRQVRVGDDFLPCAIAFKTEKLHLGSEVRHGDMIWKVTELVS